VIDGDVEDDMPKDKSEAPQQGMPSRAELPPTVPATSQGYSVSDSTDSTTIAFSRRDIANPKQEALWNAIRLHTEQIGFNHFADFVDRALCQKGKLGPAEVDAIKQYGRPLDLERLRSCDELSPFGGYMSGVDLYQLLKLASEIFLLLRCGICRVTPDRDTTGAARSDGGGVFGINDGPPTADQLTNLNGVLTDFLGADRGSYISAIVRNVFGSAGFKESPFCPVSVGLGPCLLELIWSYWHEEAMLVQTTNAIALRFQNIARRGRDPLGEFELDPLRPLSGFIWGYIQDEPSRLSVARRVYEYHHEYGLDLVGRPRRLRLRPADSRSKFLQAFHDLLRLTDQFYREASDNTVTPDPFPLLIALRDLHMILAEGAHNQFRDLPWTARSEMLVQQWLLARGETRDFLRGRFMTPYPEGWMGAVDAMKRLQGWTDTNVVHFSDLAKFGERLLLSVRHVRWDAIADPFAAQDWALSWRPEIQGYIHAYRMVTGIMLSDDIVEMNRPDSPRYLQPAVLLRGRLVEQRRALGLPARAPSRLALPPRTRLLDRS
jgi:hypothetical protein